MLATIRKHMNCGKVPHWKALSFGLSASMWLLVPNQWELVAAVHKSLAWAVGFCVDVCLDQVEKMTRVPKSATNVAGVCQLGIRPFGPGNLSTFKRQMNRLLMCENPNQCVFSQKNPDTTRTAKRG